MALRIFTDSGPSYLASYWLLMEDLTMDALVLPFNRQLKDQTALMYQEENLIQDGIFIGNKCVIDFAQFPEAAQTIQITKRDMTIMSICIMDNHYLLQSTENYSFYLIGALSTQSLTIHVPGELVFLDRLMIENKLDISARSVRFRKPLSCSGGIFIAAEKIRFFV